MTTFYGLEGTRALISDREQRLLQEAERAMLHAIIRDSVVALQESLYRRIL